jgi:hypothetical protein
MILNMLGMLAVSMKKVQALTVKVGTIQSMKKERVTLIGEDR